MKCEKCGNEYPSQYYFATPTICNECFKNLSPEEQRKHYEIAGDYFVDSSLALRVGFGKRLGAALLDLVIFNIIFFLVFYFTGKFNEVVSVMPGSITEFFSNPDIAMELEAIMKPVMTLIFIIGVVYYSMEIFLAATPGKMLLGIQIACDDRKRGDIPTLFIRFIFKHIDYVFTLLVLVTSIKIFDTLGTVASIIILIGFFFVLAEKRQAFHDMIAKTAVYHKGDIIDSDEQVTGSNKT